jgi:hypothetical protein
LCRYASVWVRERDSGKEERKWGAPVLGPRNDSIFVPGRHVPEVWHAPFCGAAIILKMRICRRWRSAALIWPRPARGGVIGRRARGGEELIHLEELRPGNQSHASAFPPRSFSFFPLPTLCTNKKKTTQRTFHQTNIDKLPRNLVDNRNWGFGALPPLMLSVDASL